MPYFVMRSIVGGNGRPTKIFIELEATHGVQAGKSAWLAQLLSPPFDSLAAAVAYAQSQPKYFRNRAEIICAPNQEEAFLQTEGCQAHIKWLRDNRGMSVERAKDVLRRDIRSVIAAWNDVRTQRGEALPSDTDSE